MSGKRALLIAGGGTLGGYTYPELLDRGWQVDILDAMPRVSLNRNLHWIQGRAEDALLRELFRRGRYDVIVDFIHYTDPGQYRTRGKLLLENTDQLIFLSSYRIYADSPLVTEDSPQLLDVSTDEYFLTHETYAVPKSWNERFLRSSGFENWTIIRPMISFSHYRLDLVTSGAQTFLLRALQNKKTLLPVEARYLTAGVGWAGNVGRMIAALCGNEKALGEAFTLGAAEEQTWQDVADLYTELTGAEFVWVGKEDYLTCSTPNNYMERCMLLCDRLYDRKVDISKVLRVTGIARDSLVSTRAGVIRELEVLAERPDLMARFDAEPYRTVNQRMDEYLARHAL